MNKRHGVLHVRPEQYGGYGKKGCVRVMLHPTTTRKDSAAAQLVHYTLHHCMLGQTPSGSPSCITLVMQKFILTLGTGTKFPGPHGCPELPTAGSVGSFIPGQGRATIRVDA